MIKPRQTKAIALMLLCTIFASTAHILFKFGANTLNYAEISSFFNWPLVMGLFSLGVGAIFMMAAFRLGELTLVFPVLSTSYVWVSLLSPLFFPQDSMNVWKWVGVIIILISVSGLGLSSSLKKVKNSG